MDRDHGVKLGKGQHTCILGWMWIMGSACVFFALSLIPVLTVHENTKNESLPLNAQRWGGR